LVVLDKGSSFGELALLENKPRAATIKCKTDCSFAVLDKKHFTEILSNYLFIYFLKNINLKRWDREKKISKINWIFYLIVYFSKLGRKNCERAILFIKKRIGSS